MPATKVTKDELEFGGAWASHTAALSGWAAGATQNNRWIQIGKTVIYQYNISGTSDSTGVTIGLPVTAKSNGGFNTETVTGLLVNNGAVWGTPGRAYIDPNTNPNIMYVAPAAGTSAFTASGTKQVRGIIIYEAV